MLRFAVVICCVLTAQGFLLDSVASIVGTILNGGPAPKTVTQLEDAKYLGRWYQVYASKSVALTFERNAYCVTADYGVAADGRITVLNTDRLESVTGPLDVIHGYATKSSTVGQLSVNLETVPIPAPYWVIKLGPDNYGPNGLYQYSVVTDNLKATLFVLARNVTTFYSDYNDEVMAFLKEQGFNSVLNEPIKTVHDDQCVYSPLP
ncbi:apolipoprotein D-like [Littorina saxatilis]|uniref:Lipocalin/cytosolic fatty-acid binding domain-containing protein n=1 Tax=Littorina saxatilis TaxID=31220 RepID=A0AAN9GLD3_9CAEN